MANQHITQLVDDLISKGRIQTSMRDQYINLMAANPQLEEEFSGMLLRGGDYTNKTKQLAEQHRQNQAAIEAERAKVQEERAKLQNWERQVQGQLQDYDKVVKDLPTMTAKLAAYEQMLKDHELNGRPMIDYVNVPLTSPTTPPYSTPPPPRTMNPTQDPPNVPYLKREEAAGAIRDLVVLQEKVDAIKAQHHQLFGEYLSDNLLSHSLTTGEDPEQHWRVKHNVDAKLADLRAKEELAREAAMEARLREKIMQEVAMNPGKITGSPNLQGGASPLFEAYGHSRALQHAQPHANDNAAVGGDAAPKFIPPEKRDDIPSSQARVSAAANKFATSFDPNTGQPISDEGRRMFNKYSGIGND